MPDPSFEVVFARWLESFEERQREFARRCGMSESYLSELLNCDKPVAVSMINQLMDRLGIDVITFARDFGAQARQIADEAKTAPRHRPARSLLRAPAVNHAAKSGADAPPSPTALRPRCSRKEPKPK